MFIAFEGGVRTGEAAEPGEIEITAADYAAAIDGMAAGKVVSVAGGFAMALPAEDPEPVAGPPTSLDVNRERDRRLGSNFTFGGKPFQRDVSAVKRITGAYSMALAAIVGGAQTGNYRWHGGSADFAWIAADNSLVAMDAQTVIAFGNACAAIEEDLVIKARAIKDLDPIPDDFAADAWWQ